MKVLKFGGTSMGTAESLRQIEQIFSYNIQIGEHPILVCSAMSGVTSQLIEIGRMAEKRKLPRAIHLFEELKLRHLQTADELGVRAAFEVHTETLFTDLANLIRGIGLILEMSNRSQAYLTSFGERLSTRLLTAYLKKNGHPAQQFDSNFIKTTGKNFLKDEVDFQASRATVKAVLLTALQQGISPVITGFYGTNSDHVISLLGRGGSDYSGAIVAVSLDIKTLEIWTDVDGFLTADPRIVEEAHILEQIGFQEAAELCFYGAKVLHPMTIRPVIERGGEVRILNTFKPRNKGTIITQHPTPTNDAVISISSKGVYMLTLDLFAIRQNKREVMARLFSLSENLEINIDMIAASEAQISFCVERTQDALECFLDKLKDICPFELKKERSVVCIVSPADVQGQIGVAGRIFSTIAESGVSVEMYSQNASEIAQLIVVPSKVSDKVIANIHENLVRPARDLSIRKNNNR